MVQVEPTGKGHEVREVAPRDCPNGHNRMAPTFAQCTKLTCRAMCRQWRCLEGGCTHRVVDPDHLKSDRHRKGEAPLGLHHGG